MSRPLEWYNAAGERWCVSCRAYVAVDLFHRTRSAAPDGLARACRVCRRRLGRAAYRAHPEQRERASARALAWQAEHPERAREIHRQAQRTYAIGQRLLAVRASRAGVGEDTRRSAGGNEAQEGVTSCRLTR